MADRFPATGDDDESTQPRRGKMSIMLGMGTLIASAPMNFSPPAIASTNWGEIAALVIAFVVPLGMTCVIYTAQKSFVFGL